MHHHRTRLAGVAITLTLGSLAAACSASGTLATPPVSSAAAMLVGSWDLLSGCGGLAGQCIDASKLNEPSRYVFEARGFVTAYRGSATLFRTTYTVTPGSTDGTGDERPLLIIGGGPLVDPRPLRVRFTTSDTLDLDEGCCDRFTFRFRRNH